MDTEGLNWSYEGVLMGLTWFQERLGVQIDYFGVFKIDVVLSITEGLVGIGVIRVILWGHDCVLRVL